MVGSGFRLPGRLNKKDFGERIIMTAKRLIVSAVLIGCVAMSMSGCKKWRRGSSSTAGTSGTEVLTPGTGAGTDSQLPGRGDFEGANVAGGQFDVVHFAYDSAQIEDAERAKIEAAAQFLAANPKVGVVLEGHCDERGSNEYNMSLGERRALAVRSYLMNLGVDGARIQTKSLGEEQPKDPGHTEEAWAANRRVEFAAVQQ
jgi:peptidoglycan-associated lipoprotein